MNQPGDKDEATRRVAFLVASDGLWDNIKEETIKSILHQNEQQGPLKISEKLMKTALKSNAKPDDVSLVFVSLKDETS